MGNCDTVIPSAPEGDFSTEEWRTLTEMLKAAEPTFRGIAAEQNLRLLSNSRWPELRVRRQTGWTTTEFLLALHPNRARNQADAPRWAINVVRHPRLAWLPFGHSNVETIAVHADDELRAGGRVEDRVQRALRRLRGTISTVT